ncbi:MAG: DUF4065 domain-containing protein [Acidimicrobiaceae bacterium]|nr:DUF4065 domain-containing protein [Acidimicrobiaceae bacterium]
MADVLSIAASMVARELEMTSMRLQKLLYYAHGCHLATHGTPLFSDRIEAWSNGPVVRTVFSEHRGWKTLRHPWPGTGRAGAADALDQHEKDTLETVQQALADFSADELVECAHGEAPWRDARGELADDAWSNVAIPDESIRGFFTAALMSRNEPSQDEFGAALLSLYCEYAARRAFMPPVFRDADELDEWHRQLDDAPEHLDGLRSFMNAPSVFDPA